MRSREREQKLKKRLRESKDWKKKVYKVRRDDNDYRAGKWKLL